MRTIDLLTEAATRYYLRADSQVDIARDLGLDPSTVSRYLRRARDESIVHMETRPPRRSDVDLGRSLSPADPEDEAADGQALAVTAAGFVWRACSATGCGSVSRGAGRAPMCSASCGPAPRTT